ncbi:MAG TPA: efflux RND transporter periplasmic adaptor subunit [Hyphomicrobiaceae bacterium]|jgi:multidrug efflux system membrane fusion protein|nr:efflux RND transporter periplasmic adaptor subunit [Hyphomicrobiaceae bacterium]
MAQARQRLRTRSAWFALLFLLATALAAASWGWWRFGLPSGTPSQPRARATTPAPPVHTAIVEKRSFPVVLNGLGTVQATNTVTIRSRVDGQIERVAFEEGQMVKEGELLVQIDPAPFQAALDQAVAKHGQDEASLTNAKQDLQRTSILSKQGNATQQLLDQRTAQVASLTAQVQADQAAIASAKVQLDYTTIKSPLTGRAGFRLVDPGNIVHANDQNGILMITQLQPITVIFTAPEQDLPAITEALKSGPLQVTAYSTDGHKALADGTLKLIDNQVDVASGTIKLKAIFANKDGALWPGLSVSTRLLVRTIKNVVVVPDSAVQRGPDGLFAYVVGADGKAQLRNLKVGRIEDGQALVEDGLAPGERIVTSGHYRVLAGRPVEIVDGQARQTADKRAADKVD